MKTLKIPDQVFWPVLAVIVFAGLGVRTYGLGGLPDGLYCDEAANGYDAYCILKTGKSTFGHDVPLFFNHHNGDYVEALYTYLSVPLVSLFGLTVFSTRLLAALAGTCTILTTSLLSRELFNRPVGLITAFLVAFSPWNVVLSRVAFRGILLPLCITLSVYLFIRSLKNAKLFPICGLVFGLTLHSYAVAKLLVPLLVLALALIYRETLIRLIRQDRKALPHVFAGCFLFLVFAVPVYHFSLLGPGNQRFTELSIFNDSQPVHLFLKNYLLHLSPDFLFFQGDPNSRHSIRDFGELLLVLMPFVFLGIGVAVHRRSQSHLLPPIFFFLGIIPPSVTNESLPHALRAIGAFPFLEITAATGILFFAERISRVSRPASIALLGAVVAALFANTALFAHTYFVKYRADSQHAFQYGMEEAIRTTEKELDNYDSIVFSPNVIQAYIFILFFARPDPTEFQAEGQLGKYQVNVTTIPTPGHYLAVVGPDGLPGFEVKHLIRGAEDHTFLKLVKY